MIRLSLFPVFLFIFSLLPARAAAPLDLGQGLLYCRVHALPGDLPGADAEKKPALVLDLRYVATDSAGAEAFAAWLRFRPAAQPLFILFNAGTQTALLNVLAAQPGSAAVTLGPPLPALAPDVPLKLSPATEREAYAALDHGATVESLIVENVDKPRYDEAAMVKEHASDSAPPPEDEGDSGEAAAKKPAPPPQLLDLALQRAVQLHRALLALHKIRPG